MRAIVAFLVSCSIFLMDGGAAPGLAAVRDLARIVKLSDPHLSPDGGTVAVVETRADLESDECQSEIVLVDVAAKTSRPLTRARHHAAFPRWSPSGKSLGFLAPDGDKVMQLFVKLGDVVAMLSGGDRLCYDEF